MKNHPFNMKNFYKIGLLFLVFLFQKQGIAQKWSVGVQGGRTFAIAQFKGQKVKQYPKNHLEGFNLSTTIQYHFTKKWAISSGFGWQQRGGELSPNPESYLEKIKMNYLEMPLGIQFEQHFLKNWSVFLQNGVSFGRGLNAVHTRTPVFIDCGNFGIEQLPEKFRFKDQKNHLNQVDFSTQSAVGFSYKIGNHRLIYNLRITQSLTHFMKDYLYKNEEMDVRVGYLFYF